MLYPPCIEGLAYHLLEGCTLYPWPANDLDCGYRDDASSYIAGKSAITRMMKYTNKQRNCKSKHVVDKTSWETWVSFFFIWWCMCLQRAVTSAMTTCHFQDKWLKMRQMLYCDNLINVTTNRKPLMLCSQKMHAVIAHAAVTMFVQLFY